jgi:hypothetical protein
MAAVEALRDRRLVLIDYGRTEHIDRLDVDGLLASGGRRSGATDCWIEGGRLFGFLVGSGGGSKHEKETTTQPASIERATPTL